MGDEWDDDEWDVDDSQLDSLNAQEDEEEEDLAVKEAELAKKLEAVELKKKGNARLQKEEEAKTKALEAKAAKKALALEAELEANMSPTERARLEEERAADDAMEAFGGPTVGNLGADKYAGAGDKVVLKDLKDHLKVRRSAVNAEARLSEEGGRVCRRRKKETYSRGGFTHTLPSWIDPSEQKLTEHSHNLPSLSLSLSLSIPVSIPSTLLRWAMP